MKNVIIGALLDICMNSIPLLIQNLENAELEILFYAKLIQLHKSICSPISFLRVPLNFNFKWRFCHSKNLEKIHQEVDYKAVNQPRHLWEFKLKNRPKI